MHQLDKSIDKLWAHALPFPQDYAQSSTAQHYLHASLGGCQSDNIALASSKAVPWLDTFYSLTSFTQRTSVHSQAQFIGSKTIQLIYLGSKFPLQIYSGPFSPQQWSTAATNGPPNSNRVPSQNDPAKIRPPALHTSPIVYPWLASTSFPKTRRLC